MRLFNICAVVITLCLFITPAIFAQIQNSALPQYDAVRDFSLASNPNGVWSYGALTKFHEPLILFTTACSVFGGDSNWAWAGCNTPRVLHNDTSQTICFWSICVPPNYLDLDIGNNGEGPFISVVRWTAPESGTFRIYGSAEGLDYIGPTTTDLRVIYNTNRLLLTVAVDSYATPFTFSRQLTLSAGDTIDFAIDMGSNRDWHFDSTGIQFKVIQVQ